MCGSKRRAAAYREYAPAGGSTCPTPGACHGRRGCGSGHCRPGLIRTLVTKAIENRNKKIDARQLQEEARQLPRQPHLPDPEKQQYSVVQERQAKAQPVKIVYDNGHEEYVSTYDEKHATGAHTEPQRSEHLPRYSEVMKT